jgi:hypothetical protein
MAHSGIPQIETNVNMDKTVESYSIALEEEIPYLELFNTLWIVESETRIFFTTHPVVLQTL